MPKINGGVIMNIKKIQKMLRYNSSHCEDWVFKSWHKYNDQLWFFNGYMMVAIPKYEEAKILRYYPEESKQKINIKKFIPQVWQDWGSELGEFSFNQEFIDLVHNIWKSNFIIKIDKYRMVFIHDNEVIGFILGRR